MALRGVRGATCLERDAADHMRDRVVELIRAMLDLNGLGTDDLVSVILTATADLHSSFPATAARSVGLGDVPLLSAQEVDVEGALPRVVRVLAHVETSLQRREITHVYQHGAEVLRQDLAQ